MNKSSLINFYKTIHLLKLDHVLNCVAKTGPYCERQKKKKRQKFQSDFHKENI